MEWLSCAHIYRISALHTELQTLENMCVKQYTDMMSASNPADTIPSRPESSQLQLQAAGESEAKTT